MSLDDKRYQWDAMGRDEDYNKCNKCGGTGMISVAGGWAGYEDEPCSDCDGSGVSK